MEKQEQQTTAAPVQLLVSQPSVGTWWKYQNQRYQVKKVEDGVVYAGRNGNAYFVDEVSVRLAGWYRMFQPSIDCCPTTGEPDCGRCSGEFCEVHGHRSCDCDVNQRHDGIAD